MTQDAVVAVVEGRRIGWLRLALVLVALALSVVASHVADALQAGVAVRGAFAGAFVGLAAALVVRPTRRR